MFSYLRASSSGFGERVLSANFALSPKQYSIVKYKVRKVKYILKLHMGNLLMREKEYYREHIIAMVQKINRCDILEYIYTLVYKIVKREGEDI